MNALFFLLVLCFECYYYRQNQLWGVVRLGPPQCTLHRTHPDAARRDEKNCGFRAKHFTPSFRLLSPNTGRRAEATPTSSAP
jgi:hypothetical protein